MSPQTSPETITPEKITVPIRQLDPELPVPGYAYPGDAGADLLADVTAHAVRVGLQRPQVSGLYHAVAGGTTTWHGYASHVIQFARAAGQPIQVAADAIAPVPTSAFPTPARRPSNSRLDTRRLQETFDLVLPSWQRGVDRMLTEVIG